MKKKRLIHENVIFRNMSLVQDRSSHLETPSTISGSGNCEMGTEADINVSSVCMCVCVCVCVCENLHTHTQRYTHIPQNDPHFNKIGRACHLPQYIYQVINNIIQWSYGHNLVNQFNLELKNH